MTQNAHDVFISYASAEKGAADRVRDALETSGLRCWIADRDIEAGTIFPATIVEALESARVLVLILTEHSALSPHVLSEVGHAFNGKKPIVPFRLSDAALPAELDYYLSTTQWLDASDGLTDLNLGRLVESTRQALAGKKLWKRGGSQKRRVVAIAGLLAAVAAVSVLVAYWRWPEPDGPRTPVGSEAAGPRTPVGSEAAGPKTSVGSVDGQTYVFVPPGTFTMGCSPADDQCDDDEKPGHAVRIPNGFWIGKTEVTVGAYRKYAAAHGLEPPSGEDALPATGATWEEAKTYCAAVGGRLPTEAEWEYAARAGSASAFYGVPSEIAWYAENSGGTRHPVATKAANALGLHDMLGNVSEWVLDRYFNRYDLESPATGEGVVEPVAPNALATIRGGFYDSAAASVRVSHRSEMPPDAAEPIIGFRCARDGP